MPSKQTRNRNHIYQHADRAFQSLEMREEKYPRLRGLLESCRQRRDHSFDVLADGESILHLFFMLDILRTSPELKASEFNDHAYTAQRLMFEMWESSRRMQNASQCLNGYFAADPPHTFGAPPEADTKPFNPIFGVVPKQEYLAEMTALFAANGVSSDTILERFDAVEGLAYPSQFASTVEQTLAPADWNAMLTHVAANENCRQSSFALAIHAC